MRRASKPTWISSKEGSNAVEDMMGVGLGSDLCAEHEWGVADMQRAFECSFAQDGIARRRIMAIPNNLQFFTGRNYDGIMLEQPKWQSTYEARFQDLRETTLKRYGDAKEPGFVTAWDQSTFGLCAYGPKDDPARARVRLLWDAFQRKDIALWTSVGVFHLGSGLLFVIVSKVPDEQKEVMLNHDLSQQRLSERMRELGIEEELRAAGKGWFALSPRWTDDQETDLKIWLNPTDQRVNNSGYFTVEELRQWIKGSGPVPRTTQKEAR